MNFICNYPDGYSLWKCAANSAVSNDSTAVNWASFCRDLFIKHFVQDISPMKLSGVVETDESLFGWRTKYHIKRTQKEH